MEAEQQAMAAVSAEREVTRNRAVHGDQRVDCRQLVISSFDAPLIVG